MTSGPMWKLLIDGLGILAGKAVAIRLSVARKPARARTGPGVIPGPVRTIYRGRDGHRRAVRDRRRRRRPRGGPRWSWRAPAGGGAAPRGGPAPRGHPGPPPAPPPRKNPP